MWVAVSAMDAGQLQVEDNLCAGQSHVRSCVERHDREDDLLRMLQQRKRLKMATSKLDPS
jgi:hypothetical protein